MKKLPHRLVVAAPILFGMYPVLFLYEKNRSFFSPKVLCFPVLAALLFAFAVFTLWYFILRSFSRASIGSSLFLIFFYLYGHLSQQMLGLYYRIGNFELGTNKVLYTGYFITFLVIALVLKRIRANLMPLAQWFAISAAVATILWPSRVLLEMLQKPSKLQYDNMLLAGVKGPKPDIYYIILDGFGREDILRSHYGISDPELVTFLRARGFFVADSAMANYCQTVLSLASSLNFRYLDSMPEAQGEARAKDIRPLRHLIRHNDAFSFLRKKGYTTVALSSGYWPTTIDNADVYLSARWNLGEFENALFEMTPLPSLVGTLWKRDIGDAYRNHIEFLFDRLASVHSEINPKIVFAHITSPHPPFLFAASGENTEENSVSIWDGGYTVDRYRAMYREQLVYISRRIMHTIDSILTNSKTPPVIIIQSDHGPGSGLSHNDITRTDLPERMGILQALYIPSVQCSTWATMSPVNTFRVLFNCLFGEKVGLLDDRSYFSTWKRPYRFIDVTTGKQN